MLMLGGLRGPRGNIPASALTRNVLPRAGESTDSVVRGVKSSRDLLYSNNLLLIQVSRMSVASSL